KPSMPSRARPQRRRSGESYEERCERRQESRESLRRRHNVTTCRHLARAAELPSQSPRQREFLRRRNLASDAGGTPPGQEPEARAPPDPSSREEPRPSILLQVTPAPEHSSVLSLLQHPLKHQDPGQNTAKKGDCTDKNAWMFFPQSLQAQPPPLSLFWGDTDSSCPLVPAPVELPHIPPCTLPAALHRELLLKQKMVILQQLFSTLLQASEKSWQGQLNEDKLRSKLRVLENQLQACTQSYSKECVKKILIEMEDQKQTYEQKAKEALQKMLEDKLQTEQQLQNSQRSLAETREDLAFWKEHDTALKAELTKVTTAHTELENNFHTLQSELQQADAEKEQLHQELQILRDEHTELLQRARALRSDNDRQAGHIRDIQDKLQKEQEQKVTLEATIRHLQNLIHNQNDQQKSQEGTVQRKDQVFTTQTPPLTPAKEKQNSLLEHPEEEEEEGNESLKDEMQQRTSQLTAKENECSELRSELEALSQEYQSCLTRLRQCRDELNRSQRNQPQRGHWIPLLVAVTAVAIATFLVSYRL
ncbi:T3JAM protein, partial [Menura novaehollandiae]|nr:T3JAM protein [Menura novaehollandiae]